MGAAASDTLALVRRPSFPCWLFIVTILARLVLGEFAHAMPQPAEPATQECSNHVTPDPVTPSHDSSDCCKSTQCECACIHGTAFEGSHAKGIFGTCHLPLRHSLASTQSRPNELFRPPA